MNDTCVIGVSIFKNTFTRPFIFNDVGIGNKVTFFLNDKSSSCFFPGFNTKNALIDRFKSILAFLLCDSSGIMVPQSSHFSVPFLNSVNVFPLHYGHVNLKSPHPLKNLFQVMILHHLKIQSLLSVIPLFLFL